MKIPLYLSSFPDTQSKIEIKWESIVNNEDELQRQFMYVHMCLCVSVSVMCI